MDNQRLLNITAPTRPALRYYGGKWKLAPWVIPFFPKHRCYVEPFGGAASVLLRKPPSRVEIYNDLSDEVVNLFRVLRDKKKSEELRRLLDLTPYSRSEWLACYPLSQDHVEQARRTIVLASMGHNPSKALNRKSNGFRSSSSGWHMLPQDFKRYTAALSSITSRLKNVIVENRDAMLVMAQHDSPSTLHYVDPPYVGATRTNKGDHYQHELQGLEGHAKLAEFLRSLKGYVVVSGYLCDEYENFYSLHGWQRHTTTAVTGAATKNKSKRTEAVWLNPQAAGRQKQMKLAF